jgi:hypothetical protein
MDQGNITERLETQGKMRIPTFTRCPATFPPIRTFKPLIGNENPPQVRGNNKAIWLIRVNIYSQSLRASIIIYPDIPRILGRCNPPHVIIQDFRCAGQTGKE